MLNAKPQIVYSVFCEGVEEVYGNILPISICNVSSLISVDKQIFFLTWVTGLCKEESQLTFLISDLKGNIMNVDVSSSVIWKVGGASAQILISITEKLSDLLKKKSCLRLEIKESGVTLTKKILKCIKNKNTTCFSFVNEPIMMTITDYCKQKGWQYAFSNNNVIVGENVSIGGGVFFGGVAPIVVGHDTMFASNVMVNTGTHDVDVHPMNVSSVSRPISIGCHCLIGTMATILPGVKIHDHAVVGAGSIVTAHVPGRAIVAGNPARIIRFREEDLPENQNVGLGIIGGFLDEKQVCKLQR